MVDKNWMVKKYYFGSMNVRNTYQMERASIEISALFINPDIMTKHL